MYACNDNDELVPRVRRFCNQADVVAFSYDLSVCFDKRGGIMNQADFENVVALALLNKITPLATTEIQHNFEIAVTLVLRHITPVTSADIENNAKLMAPVFGMDDIHIETAVKRLSAKFLPAMRKIQ